MKAGASHRALAIAILSAALWPSLAAAQRSLPEQGVSPGDASGAGSWLEEIIVTAQRVRENVQQTPLAITAVSGGALEAQNVQSIKDISRTAPNIQFGGGYGGTALFIRGVGQQQAGLLSDPGAAIYVDGVYHPRVTGDSTNFSDVERLEVLRGPQGTLFGKNAIGGALSIISFAPDNDLAGGLSTRIGSRDRFDLGAWVNIPLVDDKAAMRLSFDRSKQDGYMTNVLTGKKLSDTNYYTARGSLLVQPTETLNVTLRADYTNQRDNGRGYKPLIAPNPAFLTSGKYDSAGDGPSYNHATDFGLSGTVEWDMGPGTLKLIPAYRRWTQKFADDSDGAADPTSQQHVSSDAEDSFYSQEVQYVGKTLDDRLQFAVGAFYMRDHSREGVSPRIVISALPGAPPPPGPGGAGPIVFFLDNNTNLVTNSYAVFGQATYSLTDKLHLTAGVRYSKDKKDVTYTQFDETVGATTINVNRKSDYSAVTPKFTIDYQFTPLVMVYATASRGFKAGGFNGQVSSPDGFTAFQPEYLWNYEAGIKSEWFDRKLRVNIDAYRMNYTNIQIAFLQADGANTIANAGQARFNGLEAEVTALITPALMVSGSLGINDFKYTKLDPQISNLASSSLLPDSPKTTASASVNYTVHEFDNGNKIEIRADYSWRSKIYFDAVNTEIGSQKPYGLLSARGSFTWTDDRYSLFVYGNNLTNKYYHTLGLSNFGLTYIRPGPPREVGLGLTARF